jgi:hypothetical protein
MLLLLLLQLLLHSAQTMAVTQRSGGGGGGFRCCRSVRLLPLLHELEIQRLPLLLPEGVPLF